MSLNCKLALSTTGKMPDEELFRAFSDSGIEAMEISVGSKEYKDLNYSQLHQWSLQYGVQLWSFHLPFSPFDQIDISKPDLAKQTVDLFKSYMIKANEIGIKVFVIHSSGEPIEEAERESRKRCAKNSLRELAEFAAGLNCIIAVEDLPRSCLGNNSDEILDLISAHENLRVCCDTNHLLGENITDFIHRVGSKIITVHLSDYDFINERHWLPGEGKIDWVSVVSAFEDINYEGYWLYEIGFTAPWSIVRSRDLTCNDFRNNYNALMQKKQPEKLGVAKENLGMWKDK